MIWLKVKTLLTIVMTEGSMRIVSSGHSGNSFFSNLWFFYFFKGQKLQKYYWKPVDSSSYTPSNLGFLSRFKQCAIKQSNWINHLVEEIGDWWKTVDTAQLRCMDKKKKIKTENNRDLKEKHCVQKKLKQCELLTTTWFLYRCLKKLPRVFLFTADLCVRRKALTCHITPWIIDK